MKFLRKMVKTNLKHSKHTDTERETFNTHCCDKTNTLQCQLVEQNNSTDKEYTQTYLLV